MGDQKVSKMLPMLQQIAKITGLELNRLYQFNIVKNILIELQYIAKIVGIDLDRMYYNNKNGILLAYQIFKKAIINN